MKALVVGYGSIGSRHAEILTTEKIEVHVVSQHGTNDYPCYHELSKALEEHDYDGVIIANKTYQHLEALRQLQTWGHTSAVLVEKPIFHCASKASVFSGGGLPTYVGYNLRFHPALDRLKSILSQERVISCVVEVGQYLPSWRPHSQNPESYSTLKSQGGGVLRDLSHELDYLLWLFGSWSSVAALGGRYASVTKDSEDAVSLLLETKKCPMVSLHMNYLDRQTYRNIRIQTERCTIVLDLVASSLSIDGKTEFYELERNTTYRKMHRAFLSGCPGETNLCGIEEGIEVVQLIETIEMSIAKKRWVSAKTPTHS